MKAREWTLKTVKDRCRVDGDCWIWTGGVNSTGYPCTSINGVGGTSVRRWLMLQLHDGEPPEKRGVRKWVVVSECGDKRCCSPACLRWESMSSVVVECHADGHRQSVASRLACAAAAQRSFAKLSADKVRWLAETPRSAVSDSDAARMFGVSRACIGRVRRGESWRSVLGFPQASVFGGMAA